MLLNIQCNVADEREEWFFMNGSARNSFYENV